MLECPSEVVIKSLNAHKRIICNRKQFVLNFMMIGKPVLKKEASMMPYVGKRFLRSITNAYKGKMR